MVSLLNSMDLAYIRNTSLGLLPDKVTIQRKSLAGDGQGGYVEGWNNVYQNIAARLGYKSGGEQVVEGRREANLVYTLTVAYDQSIEATDRVFHNSETYEVQAVDSGKSYATTKRCQLRKL